MPKKGEDRAKKFSVKHDPNLLMLRWKALRDFSLKRFYLTPEKQFILDDQIKVLIERYILPYGKAGNYMDKVRRLVFMWEMLTEDQKAFYRMEWISEGLPAELFDKIAELYEVLKNYVSFFLKNNMVLWYFAELDPKPQEAFSPKDEDYTTIMETEYESYTPEKQPYWFQCGMSIGAIIYYLGNVFKGFDADPLLSQLILQTCRSDLGLTIDLFIPAIIRELPEYYFFLSIPDMLFQIEIPISEIIRNLVMLDSSFSIGINEYDLWLYQMQNEVFKVFPFSANILTNCIAYVETARSDPSQILINTLSNPIYEVEI